MQGTLLLTKAEIIRLRRNRRFLIFTIALPVVLYLIFAKQKATAYGVSFEAFYMVGMASFGAFSGAFNNNTIRISQERKDGWIRQLRLTPLPANAYVVAKIISSMVTTVPSIVIVLLLGRFYAGVHLEAWKWVAIGVTIWLGTLIFAALAVAVGYTFNPDSVQPVALVIYFFFVIFGGLWFPLSGGLKKFGEFTPTYQVVRISTDVVGSGAVSVAAVVGIAVWLVIFLSLATVAVRATAETV
ncbi:MAG: ABC transporter permease [Streptosporangiaceae bacterium]|nr:ABC transporter permease [Streptosporangiaceae bacterium]MBV9852956.1 ABC transporter permease [Streptosporangiaceae bacterium]